MKSDPRASAIGLPVKYVMLMQVEATTTPVTAPKSSSRTTLVLGSLPVRTEAREGGRGE